MRIMQMHVTQFSQKWGLALYCTDPLNYKKNIYIFFSKMPVRSPYWVGFTSSRNTEGLNVWNMPQQSSKYLYVYTYTVDFYEMLWGSRVMFFPFTH